MEKIPNKTPLEQYEEVKERKSIYIWKCIEEMRQGIFLCLNGVCLNEKEIKEILEKLDDEWDWKLKNKIEKIRAENGQKNDEQDEHYPIYFRYKNFRYKKPDEGYRDDED